MKKVFLLPYWPLRPAVLCLPPAARARRRVRRVQITIKDPAEYNGHTSAIGQSTPAAKASAIEKLSAGSIQTAS